MVWIKLLTWFKGELVGQDSFGNRYYRKKGPENLKERRWVIYKGLAEASKVPSEWHGWLHHTFKKPTEIGKIQQWAWEKKHLPNLSGTPYAYHPSGHLLSGGKRKLTGSDYVPWHPHEVKDENECT